MMRVRKGGIAYVRGGRKEWEARGEERGGSGEEGRRLEWAAGGGRGVAGRALSSLRASIPQGGPGWGEAGGRWRGVASPVASRPLPRPLLRPAARPPRRRRSGNMKRRCSCGGGGGHYSSERRARRWRRGRDAAGSGAERTGARLRPGRARGALRLRGSAPRSPRAAFPGNGAPRCGRLIAGLARPHAGWGREAESPRCLCAGVLAPLGAAASSRCPGPQAGG